MVLPFARQNGAVRYYKSYKKRNNKYRKVTEVHSEVEKRKPYRIAGKNAEESVQ